MKPHTNDNQTFADELFNCFKSPNPLDQIAALERLKDKPTEERNASET